MKKLLLIIALTLPFYIYSQELDKAGFKFTEKVFNAFIDGDSESLTDLYYPLKEHNEMLMVQGNREMEQDMHAAGVQRSVSRSMDSRKELIDFDWKSINIDSSEIMESEDEEGLIFFDISVIGQNESKSYKITMLQCIQFPNGKYYLTEDISIEEIN